MSIHTLPHEIITHIINYIPDKMNTSMTCKLFQTILQNTKHTENINDPYYLSKNFNMFTGIKLGRITNHNCLNFMTYNYIIANTFNAFDTDNPLMLPIFNYLATLLQQHCKINNVSKPDYINKLCLKLQNYRYTFLGPIFVEYTYPQSPDIALLIFPHIKPIYISLLRNYSQNDIYKEIDFFVDNNVLTYAEMDEYINNINYDKWLYDDLHCYIKKKLIS
jgi:hypothetical protein